MKKLLALLMSVAMLFILAACENNSSDANNDDTVGAGQTQTTESTETTETTETTTSPKDESDSSKIINDDGEEFIVNVSNLGKLKDGADAISSNKFELAGTTYTFPIKLSELFNNGWNLNSGYNYKTEFDANTKTNLIDYYLVHESGMQIHLDQIVNAAAEKKDIKECTLTGFSISIYNLVTEFDYALPGGIVPISSAANVLAVFGNPNTTTEFTGHSYNLAQQLTYGKHSSSNISYSFSFREDGIISGVHIDYEA